MAYFQLGSNWMHTQILQMQLYIPGNNTQRILVTLSQSCTFFFYRFCLNRRYTYIYIKKKKGLILTSDIYFFHYLQTINAYASSWELSISSYITEVFSFQWIIQEASDGVNRIKLCKLFNWKQCLWKQFETIQYFGTHRTESSKLKNHQ